MLGLKNISNSIATVGPLGRLPFGGALTVIVSLPVVYCVNFLVTSFPALYPWIQLIILAIAVLAVFIAQRMNEHPDGLGKNLIVVNRIIGMVLAFSGLYLNLKFLITGFGLYFLFRHVTPILILRYMGIDLYRGARVASIFLVDCLAGLAVNFVFRFIFWLVTL